jgi:hypothetical protein
MSTPISYDIPSAAIATGHSESVIRRAIRAGDLIPRYPTSKPVIRAVDLQAWIDRAPTERSAS